MSDSDFAEQRLTGLAWRKSSHSGGGNDCVEIAHGGGFTAVRDSKDPDGGLLTLGPRGWQGLLNLARTHQS